MICREAGQRRRQKRKAEGKCEREYCHLARVAHLAHIFCGSNHIEVTVATAGAEEYLGSGDKETEGGGRSDDSSGKGARVIRDRLDTVILDEIPPNRPSEVIKSGCAAWDVVVCLRELFELVVIFESRLDGCIVQ